MSSLRNICFTSFDTQVSDEDFLERIADWAPVVYGIFQRERAPTTGREHFQGTPIYLTRRGTIYSLVLQAT